MFESDEIERISCYKNRSYLTENEAMKSQFRLRASGVCDLILWKMYHHMRDDCMRSCAAHDSTKSMWLTMQCATHTSAFASMNWDYHWKDAAGMRLLTFLYVFTYKCCLFLSRYMLSKHSSITILWYEWKRLCKSVVRITQSSPPNVRRKNKPNIPTATPIEINLDKIWMIHCNYKRSILTEIQPRERKKLYIEHWVDFGCKNTIPNGTQMKRTI